MKQKRRDELGLLFDLARRAPGLRAPGVPSGFAQGVARSASRHGGRGGGEEGIHSAFRWAILASVAFTVVVCAWNAPSVFNVAFAPDTAFESHISKLALIPWGR